ncbi:flagellar hook-basal body protein [Neisseriaceae bacterium TC5R-5]|nr:flagellar hook-basal body protein [Neisseriaceae bacterium TC5R-5]
MSDFLGVMATSMAVDMQRLNTLSQNLANVATPGYKRQFSLGLADPSAVKSELDLQQGVLSRTGKELDIAIAGSGFLPVGQPEQPLFSRAGSLRLDERGRLLHALSGLPLLAEGGEIFLEPGAFKIDEQGVISQRDKVIGQLKLFQPNEQATVQAQGNGLYRINGEARSEAGVQVALRQGYLEKSNVNSSREMVELMELVRHFESVQKSVQGMDAMWDKTLRSLGEF